MEANQVTKLIAEHQKENKELKEMKDLTGEEMVGKEAMSNIANMVALFKEIKLHILGAIASVTTLFGTIDADAPVVWKILGALVGTVGTLWIAFKLAGLGATWFASGLSTMLGPLAMLGTIGKIAIPVLIAIGLIGLTVVGIMFGLAAVIEAIGNAIEKVGAGQMIAGVLGMAAAIWIMSLAIAKLAVVGWAAVPAMAAIVGFVVVAGAAGLGGFMGTRGGMTEVKEELALIKNEIHQLVRGFGEKPGEKDYIKNLSKANKGIKLEAVKPKPMIKSNQ